MSATLLISCADNLAWRPERFAWLYTRQMKKPQPVYYKNLEIHNHTTDRYYESIIDAGITEGLLFADIWRSTYTGETVFPYGHQFEVVERVWVRTQHNDCNEGRPLLLLFFTRPRRHDMATSEKDHTHDPKEHVLSVDCWCKPTVETFGDTKKD